MNDTATARIASSEIEGSEIEGSEIEGSEIGLGAACGIQILERSAG